MVMENEQPAAVHLGSGAYVSVAHPGALNITANHHDPYQATGDAVAALIRYLKQHGHIKE
jgi:hypothetical protein